MSEEKGNKMPRWPVKRTINTKILKQAKIVKPVVFDMPTTIVEGASELTGHVRPDHYGGPDNPHEVKKCLLAWGIKDNAYLYQAICMLARARTKSKTPAEYEENLNKAKTWIQFEIDEVHAQRQVTVGDSIGPCN